MVMGSPTAYEKLAAISPATERRQTALTLIFGFNDLSKQTSSSQVQREGERERKNKEEKNTPLVVCTLPDL